MRPSPFRGRLVGVLSTPTSPPLPLPLPGGGWVGVLSTRTSPPLPLPGGGWVGVLPPPPQTKTPPDRSGGVTILVAKEELTRRGPRATCSARPWGCRRRSSCRQLPRP